MSSQNPLKSARKLVLFDIDGTLLAGAGAGKNALEEAFEALYGKPIEIPPHSLSGRTDRAIGLALVVPFLICRYFHL